MNVLSGQTFSGEFRLLSLTYIAEWFHVLSFKTFSGAFRLLSLTYIAERFIFCLLKHLAEHYTF